MLGALRYFLKNQPVAVGLFAAAALLVLFFAARFVMHLGHFHDHVPLNQPLEAWMRPRYVAMSYHVPPKVMREDILKIGPPPKERDKEPITMEGIAAQRGITLEALTEIVRDGSRAFHEEKGR